MTAIPATCSGPHPTSVGSLAIHILFTVPTTFRAIKEDPSLEFKKKYDLSNFKALFLAGDRCDPDSLRWAASNLNVPIIDHWWQTETGCSICANCLGIEQLPVKPGYGSIGNRSTVSIT